jgi:hypothetical protein
MSPDHVQPVPLVVRRVCPPVPQPWQSCLRELRALPTTRRAEAATPSARPQHLRQALLGSLSLTKILADFEMNNIAPSGRWRSAITPTMFNVFLLCGIIVNLLLLSGSHDVALRDFGLSLGALALGRLSVVFE